MKSIRVVWPLRGGVLAVFALVLMFSLGEGRDVAQANDASIDFSMNVVSGGTPSGGAGCSTNAVPAPTAKGQAICKVPLKGTFVVEVQLKDPGGGSGSYTSWVSAINWTPGLQGPGDAGSTKAVSVLNCPAGSTPATAAQGGAASSQCGSGFAFTDAEATAAIGRYELNCGNSPSQELVSMTIDLGNKSSIFSTSLSDVTLGLLSDLNGTEVITIKCEDPKPVGGIAELPEVAGVPLEAPEAGGGVGLLTSLAGAVAAGTLALTGVAWYARRRWAR